jgi:hypothetical protein
MLAGTVDVTPTATPKSENPVPAAPQLQCSSPIMAGRITPRELNVVAVMRKKTTLIAAKVMEGR